MANSKALMTIIDYHFNDEALLQLALTHSSYANEKSTVEMAYNERLEFLGDAVLSIVVSDYLYRSYPELTEGQLSKTRALVVCEATLYQCAEKFGLGKFLRLGKGEANTGGRSRPSILADALEALIAAIYLDGGIAAARQFILDNFVASIAKAVAGKLFKDYKSALQEAVQARDNKAVSYRIVDQTGPAHDRQFCAVALIGDRVCGKGCGKSKKIAEQQAAKAALQDYAV